MSDFEPSDETVRAKTPGLSTEDESKNMGLAKAFLRVLGDRWVGEVVCQVCKTSRWEVGYAADARLRYAENGQVLTFIPVRCLNCHHTLLFNAVGLGLFNSDGTPVIDEETEES